jgi:hypothetical protein
MKTGSTYLQQRLAANRDQLLAAGYLFPGARWLDQVRAAQDAVGLGRRDPRLRAQVAGAWDRMVRQIHGHSGVAVVFSMEFLSFATPRQAQRVVRSLDPSPVHVVLAIRDTAATIPSQWQTSVRSGSTTSWPDYTTGVRRAERVQPSLHRPAVGSRALRTFLRAQDTVRMLQAWSPLVHPSRLHVITVPNPAADPHLLWERFATAVGMPHDLGQVAPGRTNRSLGFASTELLRQVNTALGRQPRIEYNRVVKDYLAAQVLTQLAGEEAPVRLDEETGLFAQRWNRRVVAAIEATSAALVGSLADLPTNGPVDQTGSLTRPPDTDVLQAAAVARDGMERLVRRLARRAETAVASDGHGPRADVASLQAAEAEVPPVPAAAAEIARLTEEAIRLRRHMRAARRGRS